MSRSIRVILIVSGLALLLVLVGCRVQPTWHGMVLEPAYPAPELALSDAQGRPFRLADHKGEVVLLYFGFASCPDLCPTTLAQLSQVRRALGREGERMQVALITVDPERDTPEILGQYTKVFHPSFLGLSGPRPAIEQAMRDYGVTAVRREMPGSALGYTIDHSTFIYVIDRAGRWRQLFSYGSAPEDIAKDVRALLREPL